MGRTTAKPQLKMIGAEDNPSEVCNFNFAVDRDYGDETDFFPCSAFDRNARFLDKYVEKGQLIVVEGRLKNNTWEDDKGKHKVTEINVEKVYFAGSSKKNNSQAVLGSNDEPDNYI